MASRTLHRVTHDPATSSIRRLVCRREVVLVDPELAASWLAADSRGPTVQMWVVGDIGLTAGVEQEEIITSEERPGLVALFAALMSADQWHLVPVPGDGDLIRRDEHGHLVDGAHRLRAVVESGCSVQMHVESVTWVAEEVGHTRHTV